MDSTFPTGFPPATMVYMVFYVATWMIHVVFMNYVLAGSGYLAVVSLFMGGIQQRHRRPMALVLRDWMPFMLSATITAGVAPLLFIQILYQHRFYTANLLGSHRWMILLPVLIVAFYLCYVFKSKTISGWPVFLRLIVGAVSFLMFLFIGYSWTANHLVSLQPVSVWQNAYAEGTSGYETVRIAPRLIFWVLSAIPTMVLFVSWQLWYKQRHEQPELGREIYRCSRLALFGLVGTAFSSVWVYYAYKHAIHTAIFSQLAKPYAILWASGLVIQVVGWVGLMRRGRFTGGGLSFVTAGFTMGLLGLGVIRESIRLHHIDIAQLLPLHEKAFQVGGLPVFLIFFAITSGLCAWCFVLVRNNQLPVKPSS